MWLDKYDFVDIESLTAGQLVQVLEKVVADLGYTILVEKDTKEVLLTKMGDDD